MNIDGLYLKYFGKIIKGKIYSNDSGLIDCSFSITKSFTALGYYYSIDSDYYIVIEGWYWKGSTLSRCFIFDGYVVEILFGDVFEITDVGLFCYFLDIGFIISESARMANELVI